MKKIRLFLCKISLHNWKLISKDAAYLNENKKIIYGYLYKCSNCKKILNKKIY